MNTFSIFKSKTFWFTVLGAAAHVATATPDTRVQAVVESVSAVGAAWGIRGAVAKNGQNK